MVPSIDRSSLDPSLKNQTIGIPKPDFMTETEVTLEVAALPLPLPDVRGAWVVLLTKPSYTPGVLILHRSLLKVKSQFPLLVLYTSTLPESNVQVLQSLDIKVQKIDMFIPDRKVDIIAQRFADTWTKLVTFGLEGYDRVVMIDGDMMLLQNIDELFHMTLQRDWIAATHGCVCNLDQQSWAPKDWTRENCPFTPMFHPGALTHPTPVNNDSIRVHKLLNSGLTVLHPSRETFTQIQEFMKSDPRVPEFSFPDQDFLAAFYEGRWRPLPWTYNAIKVSRRWHADMWDDASVKNLHYICDKPWEVRPKSGDEEEETHGWWWIEWDEMIEEWKTDTKMKASLTTMKELVAGP